MLSVAAHWQRDSDDIDQRALLIRPVLTDDLGTGGVPRHPDLFHRRHPGRCLLERTNDPTEAGLLSRSPSGTAAVDQPLTHSGQPGSQRWSRLRLSLGVWLVRTALSA